jgi:hypothetical protein
MSSEQEDRVRALAINTLWLAAGAIGVFSQWLCGGQQAHAYIITAVVVACGATCYWMGKFVGGAR